MSASVVSDASPTSPSPADSAGGLAPRARGLRAWPLAPSARSACCAACTCGTLTIELPDGERIDGRGARAGPARLDRAAPLAPAAAAAAARRHRPGRVLPRRRLVDAGPSALLELGIAQRGAAGATRSTRRWPARWLDRLRHLARAQHAPRQPREHRLPLRPRQRLLRAVAGPRADLFERALPPAAPIARRGAGAKLERIVELLELDQGALGAGDRLRLGRAGDRTGAATSRRSVTGLTLSTEQLAHAPQARRRRQAWRRGSICACRTTATCRAATTASSRSRCSKPWASATGRPTSRRCAAGCGPAASPCCR